MLEILMGYMFLLGSMMMASMVVRWLAWCWLGFDITHPFLHSLLPLVTKLIVKIPTRIYPPTGVDDWQYRAGELLNFLI